MYLLSKPFGRQKSYKNTVYGMSSPVFLLLKGQQQKKSSISKLSLTVASSCCTPKKKLRVFFRSVLHMGPNFSSGKKNPSSTTPAASVATAGEKTNCMAKMMAESQPADQTVRCGETATIEMTVRSIRGCDRVLCFSERFFARWKSPPKSRALKIYFFNWFPGT